MPLIPLQDPSFCLLILDIETLNFTYLKFNSSAKRDYNSFRAPNIISNSNLTQETSEVLTIT